MTLSDFRVRLEQKLKADSIVPPKAKDLNNTITEGIKYLSIRTVPIDLLSSDLATYAHYRFINQDTFIRVPRDTVNDEDAIDIDEQLIYALLYYCNALLTQDANKYAMLIKKVDYEIDLYDYNNQQFLNTLEKL